MTTAAVAPEASALAPPDVLMPRETLAEFVVVGRRLPRAEDPNPPVYRMRVFSTNHVTALSRFWRYMETLKKIKRSRGEILGIWRVRPEGLTVKNYAVWIRFCSRKGVHNIYKEFRDISAAEAVRQAYHAAANDYRVKATEVHIVDIQPIADDQVKRPNIRTVIDPTLRFPLPHRVLRGLYRSRQTERYAYRRPTTFYH